MLPNIDILCEELHPAVEQVRRLRGDEATADYCRWSLVLRKLDAGNDVLDIGIGRGQFADAVMLTKQFARVRGADRRKHSKYRNDTGFDYVEYDLTTAPRDSLQAQIVTCLECIEHIPDPAFASAVRHLQALARERLIVTVPFEEPEPLPSMHRQRFTRERLEGLFPGGEICLLSKGATVRWALIDWRP